MKGQNLFVYMLTILIIDGLSKLSMTNVKNLEIEKENQGGSSFKKKKILVMNKPCS